MSNTIPLTIKEIKELREMISLKTYLLRLFIYALIVILITIPIRAIQNSLLEIHFPIWIIISAICTGYLLLKSKKWTGGSELRKQIKKEIKDGVAYTTQCSIKDAIEVEEQEDEGPSFYIQTDNEMVYLFSGQYLDTYNTKGFPWEKFVIIETPSKQIFKLKKEGKNFKVNKKRKPFTWDEIKEVGKDKYQIVNKQFDEILKEIENQKTGA
jgi:hypothetical protein